MELYKCFNKGLVNRYGKKYEVNKLYSADGEIKFGNSGNGFHMCKYLEDTLRYFDAMNDEVDIGLVHGFGKEVKYDDEYNGFYDMYVYEKMIIDKVLTREEIIKYGLNLSEYRIRRFISLYRLNDDEIRLFLDKFKSDFGVNDYIEYYQKNNADAFKKRVLL